MAEIKISKTSGGIPWWAWLLGALILIGLIVWLATAFMGSNTHSANTPPPPPAAPVTEQAQTQTTTTDASGAQPITDLATITSSTDGSLNGRPVQLTHVPVGQMAGDASFWIGGANGDRVYVVLNEQPEPSNNVEGRVNVNAGDNVDLVGTLKSASDAPPNSAALRTKTDPLPAGVTQYIYAQSATVDH